MSKIEGVILEILKDHKNFDASKLREIHSSGDLIGLWREMWELASDGYVKTPGRARRRMAEFKVLTGQEVPSI